MNGMVDSRVVEMHFDNSDFMEKINETIEALERLNDQISSINQSQGLNKLGENITNNDLSHVATAVDSIRSRFSTLGIVGMTVIQRLTNAGIDMAMKLGSGIKSVLNQVEAGGKQRALNLEQAKFRLEGVLGSVEKVNQVMSDVDNAVQGTAYGLDEAAVAASMFAATGIEAGESMETTLRSVAGIAATFGTDFQTISNIMVDAAAAGHLTNDALTRLTMQGVPAMQMLQKEFGKTSEEIQKMCTNGEISFEEFAKIMDNTYGQHAKDANKTFQGALANTRTALSRLGAKFYEPAFTFGIDIFNELREDINAFSKGVDGAAKSFSVFGKYFTDSFVGTLKTLRDSGTFENIGKGISNIVSALTGWRGILRTIRDSFVEVFPAVSVKNISGISEAFLNLTKRFKDLSNNTVFLEKFKNIMVGIFSIFKAGINIISGVARVLGALVKAIAGFIGSSNSLSEGFANIGKSLSNMTGAIGIFDLLVSVIDGAGKVVSKAFDTIVKEISAFTKSIGESISGIGSVNEALGILGLAYAAFFAEKKTRKAKFWSQRLSRIFLQGKKLFETVTHESDTALAHFNDLFDGLNNNLRAMERSTNVDIIKKIAVALLALAIALKIIASIDPGDLTKSLGAVTVLMTEMMGAMAVLMKMLSGSDITSNIKSLYAMGSVTNALIKIGAAMILMAIALKTISELDPKQLAAGLVGMTVMLASVLGFVIALDKFQTNVADAKVGSMMIGVALALTLIAKAVKTMGSLKPTEIVKGLSGIIIIMGAIFGFMVSLNKMGAKSSGGMVLAGLGMIAIATAINILAPALEKLGSMSLEQMAKGLTTMAIAMVSMAAVSQSMSAGGAVGMLVMSMALSSLGTTIERIGSLDISTIAKGLGTIIVAIAALGAAAVILAPASAALLALGGAMILVSASIAIFGAGLIMIGAGLTSISAGIMSFASVSTTSLGMFVNAMKMVLLELINLIPSVAAKLAEGFVVFLEQIASLAPRFTEAMTTIIHSLLDAVDKNAPDIIDTGVRLVIKFMDGMSKAIPQIAGKAMDMITEFLNTIADKMPDLVDAGFNLILSFINGLADGIRKHKRDFVNAIENLCTAGLEAFLAFFGIASPSKVMEKHGENLVEGLKQGIANAGDIGNLLISAVSSGLDKIKSTVSKYTGKGRELITGIGQGIKDKAGDIKDKISDAVSKAKDKIATTAIISKFKSAGKNLSEGIASGIRNGLSSILSATGSIADRALSHFKSKLKIHSPSKVFAEEAIYIPEGIALGINKGTRFVTKAVSKIADGAVDAMSEAVSKSYDILGSGDNFNPTITPILDLSQVKKESAGLNSMFGNETVSLASSFNQNDIQNIQNNNLMNQLLTKMDRILNTDTRKPTNITNTFTVNGNDNPEEFVNTFIRTLDREMQMRAV